MTVNMTSNAALLQNTSDLIGLTMSKKANDIQAQSMMTLINSIPQPQSAANLPPNLGQNINTTA